MVTTFGWVSAQMERSSFSAYHWESASATKTGGQYLAHDLLQKGRGFEQPCIVFRTPVNLWLD